MTVGDVIDCVVGEFGGPIENAVDTVKAGDPTVPVRGVVTTFMATAAVIRKAAALGANLIFTHEPIFYNHADETGFLQNDPVYAAKRRLLEESGAVVCRLHDYPHGLAGGAFARPASDPFIVALVEAMGWDAYADPHVPYFCTIPPTHLADLLGHFKEQLGVQSLRVTGDLDMECRRVILLLGAGGIGFHVASFDEFDADVLVTGEAAEWEAFAYAEDARELGVGRAVVALGHQPSEEPGMARLTTWLRERFPRVPITHVPSGHPIRSR